MERTLIINFKNAKEKLWEEFFVSFTNFLKFM